jgi:hypothetical protein
LVRPTARAATPVRASGGAISLVADIVFPLAMVASRYRIAERVPSIVGAAGIEPATSRV